LTLDSQLEVAVNVVFLHNSPKLLTRVRSYVFSMSTNCFSCMGMIIPVC